MMAADATRDAHPFLRRLAESARLVRTRHAYGTLTWRLWGSGPPIVLLHGGHGTWRHWAKNIGELATGHTVAAADMPGFGDSDVPDATTMSDYGATIGEGIDQLGLGDTFVLAGFSFGGMVGAALPDRMWPRISHFAIIGAPGLGRIHPVITELKTWRKAPMDERPEIHRFNLQRMMLHHPQSIDDLAIEIQTTNTLLTRAAHRSYVVDGDFQARLERLRPPLSAMWGERDSVVEGLFEPRLALLERIRPGSTVTLVPGAGHWLPYEAPDAVNAHLRNVLSNASA